MKNVSSPAGSPSRFAHAASKPGEYLTFQLGAVRYGIDILRVQEIRSFVQPVRLPHTADFIKGVINLRGCIVPILDLRVKLNCAEVAYNTFTVVIVLDLGTSLIGAVVDSVADVVMLTSELIKPAPQLESQANVGPSFIQGIANMDDRMLILIDIAALLSRDDISLVDPAVAVCSGA